MMSCLRGRGRLARPQKKHNEVRSRLDSSGVPGMTQFLCSRAHFVLFMQHMTVRSTTTEVLAPAKTMHARKQHKALVKKHACDAQHLRGPVVVHRHQVRPRLDGHLDKTLSRSRVGK